MLYASTRLRPALIGGELPIQVMADASEAPGPLCEYEAGADNALLEAWSGRALKWAAIRVGVSARLPESPVRRREPYRGE